MSDNQQMDYIKKNIFSLAEEYINLKNKKNVFKAGDRINYAEKVYDANEITNLIDSCLEFWLTNGRYTKLFEEKLAEYLGRRFCFFVNSGSSANLLAFMALTSPLLGDRAVKRGDEVITTAACFPTTVTPVLQFGAVPVFVDVTIPQYNIDISRLQDALSGKTKAVFIAHTLGNPFNISAVKRFCDDNNLWLIEDNCDSLGSKYTMNGETRLTGTFGHIATSSFYPAHHITTGEGGAVYTDDKLLAKIIASMRDWGRDCVCSPGQDNKCKSRFSNKYSQLPTGYDHKYVYSHFGYNLKATDMQAAIGCAQLDKVDSFSAKRRRNYNKFLSGLSSLRSKGLVLPEICENSEPSPFGFIMSFENRNPLVNCMEEAGIQTRMLFSGNIIRHPCFDYIRGREDLYRVAGELTNTDRIISETFWIGVHPGLSDQTMDYILDVIHGFFKSQ